MIRTGGYPVVSINNAYTRTNPRKSTENTVIINPYTNHLELLAGYINTRRLSNTLVKRDEYGIRNKDDHEKQPVTSNFALALHVLNEI